MSALDRLRNLKRRLTVIAVSIVLMALTACATAPAPNAVEVQPTSAPVMESNRATGDADGTAVWVKGHYSYLSGRYVWVPGYWRY